ncbi:S9 family peptidase [Bacillus chungangensis]|uniref:Dipeptidyl aminopeptidase/acylaminoacyl peptidase n=1 Tax=Bacillus chungangensis TaxID=587633 RepID=A0ABT9WVG5_9BACI|nr:dipeptidyl aminopeptidase/acylaminoacyl peptidase [Bacillus chungangensis]
MSKKFLLTTATAMLLASCPLNALANESNDSTFENKKIVAELANNETGVSAQDFIEHALTELTFQHASEEMRAEIVKQWVHDGELENRKESITSGEVARIFIRALGVEKDEKSVADYLQSAKNHDLFKADTQVGETVTASGMENLIEQYKKVAAKHIDDTGVPEISVEDFMKNPGDSNYQLSPDGNYLSYSSAWENHINVFVKKIGDDSEPVRVTSSKDRDIDGFFWKDDQILYIKDNGGDEIFHIYSSSFNGQEERDLTPYPDVRVQIVGDARLQVISGLQGVKDEILISMNKEDPTVFDVYRLNIKTGETTLVAKNPGNIESWLTDHDGKIRIAIESDGVNSTVLYRDSEEEAFRPFVDTKDGDTIRPIAFSKDNQSIYAVSNKDRDKAELVKFDLQANEEVLYSNPQVDVIGAKYDTDQDKLLYSIFFTDKRQYIFFDEDFENSFNSLTEKLQVSESELTIIDYNKERTKFIVSISSDKVYGTYYYYDSTSDELTKLAELGSWLNKEHLADMHPISYKSRDGLTIHGYLTLPKNKNPENLPLIVNPHGGPWGRDTWGFNPEVQLLANRGYAVLQVNFRSSVGYGKEFVDAGNKQWGLKIQDDITDGVQWAIDQGIADPDRIGIYGASFGGYATLAGITFTPDLYAAAVDYVGVSNIFTFLETIPPYWETMRNELYKRVGHPIEDKELLEQISPVFHVDKIKTPLFVAQGANDPRVNKAESDQIVEALQARGIDVEYMLKDNEGHIFENEENRIEFYNAMIKFLDDHLK